MFNPKVFKNTITLPLLFQVEFYTMYHAKFAVTIVVVNITEYSLVTDAQDFSKDPFVGTEIMYANRNWKEIV